MQQSITEQQQPHHGILRPSPLRQPQHVPLPIPRPVPIPIATSQAQLRQQQQKQRQQQQNLDSAASSGSELEGYSSGGGVGTPRRTSTQKTTPPPPGVGPLRPGGGRLGGARAKSPLSYTTASASVPVPGAATTPATADGAAAAVDDGDWSYGETAAWGWVVLFGTWFVFVTGMGSCLGVWSWAWDVGTTPYAPPELEDDDTLPIVGYYPALIILSAVMAWVWVVVAWVGMKYFRHAKISGD